MAKILCIGNNTKQTDLLTEQQAQQGHSVNHGLLVNINVDPTDGYYHTSLADHGEVTDLLQLAKKFDRVIFFNQSDDTYDNVKTYQLTQHAVHLIESRYKIPVETIDA